jgi:hypothetical protein
VAAGTSGGLTIWDLRNTSTPYMFALAGAHTSPGPVWSLAFSDRLDHELFATTNNALYHLAWPHKACLGRHVNGVVGLAVLSISSHAGHLAK